MNKEYELVTIKDIFDKVPTDRIEDCMKELTQVLMQSKQSKAFTDSLLSDVGLADLYSISLERIVWKDDGEGVLTTTTTINGEPFFIAEAKAK
jgi:hypothetical protein